MKIVGLFKILANQKRIEILSLLKDSCRTPEELSEMIGASKETVLRHLKKLERWKLVKKIGKKGDEDLYDLHSVKIYKLLASATKINPSGLKEEIPGDRKVILDVRGEVCPVPMVETEEAFKKLKDSEILEIWTDYPLSKERIISKYREHLVGISNEENFWRISLKK